MEIPEAGDPLYFLLPRDHFLPPRAEKAGRVRRLICRNQDGTFTVGRTLEYGGPGNGTWVVRRFPGGDKYSCSTPARAWLAVLGDEALFEAPTDELLFRYGK
jgi:hypothetical protein